MLRALENRWGGGGGGEFRITCQLEPMEPSETTPT